MVEAFRDVEQTDESLDDEIREDIVEGVDCGDGSRGHLIPFSYYGGKYKHLNWLLPLLPQRKAYVEPFGGSGVVLLNREQSDVETFNDLHGKVTNFFKVLRDNPEELFQKVSLTPYSEEEFEIAQTNGDVSDMEQARRFFIVANQAYDAVMSSPSWGYSKSYSSRGVSKKVSNYQAKLRRLGPIADRMSDVQVTNRDAIDVVQTFDTENGLIYCDPPYPPEIRSAGDGYVLEMSRDDHREFGEVVRSCEANVAVSSYQSELYEEMFVDNGWKRVDAEEKKLSASPSGSSSRTECLYVNYDVTDEMFSDAFGDD